MSARSNLHEAAHRNTHCVRVYLLTARRSMPWLEPNRTTTVTAVRTSWRPSARASASAAAAVAKVPQFALLDLASWLQFVAVHAPDTLGRMLDMGGGKGTFETFRDEAGDRILQPVAVAETYFHVASQHRSVWTQELDLRPFSETPWYNSDPGKVGTPLAGGGAPLPPRAKM